MENKNVLFSMSEKTADTKELRDLSSIMALAPGSSFAMRDLYVGRTLPPRRQAGQRERGSRARNRRLTPTRLFVLLTSATRSGKAGVLKSKVFTGKLNGGDRRPPKTPTHGGDYEREEKRCRKLTF